ncbi:MAG: hypothetical protein WCK08_01720 [Betaproteobacteria bacterium]
MQVIHLLLRAVLGLLRFFLRLLGFALALAMVLVILAFILLFGLLSLLMGRRPTLNVSAHFSKVRSVSDFGQTMMQGKRWSASSDQAAGAPPLLRRQAGEVQDVQARDLPPERGQDGR